MNNNSIWENYLKYSFNKLEKDIKTDVLIIGGGISGILSFYYLRDSKLKITLVERNKLLSGITSKMTAKVTILQDILTKIDNKNLELYIKSQLDGLELLKGNINKLNIKCDFFKNDSYLYTSKKNNIKKIKKIEKVLDKLNINYSNEIIPIKEIKSLYSIKVENSYEINPVKYLNGIIKLLNNNIYENTCVYNVIKKDNLFIVKTNKGNIVSKKIIFANHYPYFLKPLLFPLKVKLEKSSIIFGNSKYLGKYNLINIDKDINSIRFYKNKMIYLFNNKTISNMNKNDFKVKNNLVNNIDNYWSNMDIITNNNLPIVGELSENMYIITGFNTWGILSSHIGSLLLSNIILNKKYLKYKRLFNPHISFNVKKIINSSINIYESINGYINGIFNKSDRVFYNKNEAIYIDSNGLKHIVKRKCPHMKCNLIFNEEELTWDCPCHGSRFNIDGKIINGPSKYNIQNK